MTAKVPTSDTGTATSGMIEARQVCRNTITTMTTSRIASNSVCDDRVDRLADEDRRVVDDAVVDALRERLPSAAPSSRGRRPRPASAFDARALEDADRDRGLVVEQAAQRVAARAELDAGRRRAARVIWPSASARTTMSPNSSSVVSRPCVLIDSWKRGVGRRRRRAEHAGRDLDVLLADGAHDVGGGQLPRRPACRDRARRACCTRRRRTPATSPTPSMRAARPCTCRCA